MVGDDEDDEELDTSDEARAQRREAGRLLYHKYYNAKDGCILEEDGCYWDDLDGYRDNITPGLWIWERAAWRRLSTEELARLGAGESVLTPPDGEVYTMAAELAAWRRIVLATRQFGHYAISLERNAGEEELRSLGVDPATGRHLTHHERIR